jgi:hypothetical protein
MVEVEPPPRIDTLVRPAGGGEGRRTEYTGTAWFDGKSMMSGLLLRRPPNALRGIRTPNFQASFFIPDRLPYNRATLGDATLTISMVLQATGETGAIVDAAATFTDDRPAFRPGVRCTFKIHLGWPGGIGYGVVALTPPDTVR